MTARTSTTIGSTPPAAEAGPRPSGGASKGLLIRSVKLPATLAACTLILALVAFGIVALRGMHHLEPVDRHLTALIRLQQLSLKLEGLAVQDQGESEIALTRIDGLRRELASIAALGRELASETPGRLAAAESELAGLGPEAGDRKSALLSASDLIRKVLAAEILAHGELLARVRRDLALEFSMIGAAAIVLSGLGGLVLIRMRRRVLGPLTTLEQLLSLLANRDYSLAPTEGVDPIIRPLTTSYNHLVNRLVDLEAENARHRGALEQEVRTVTEALLEQHRSLAAAERLAATGEVAARIAHELRNPLAGMQMALSNIRSECEGDHEVAARLDLVIDELRRITGLLNGLLDQSRITAEPAIDLALASIVADLLAILRYRIPKTIMLRQSIPEDLVCRLPKDRIRQVLLNLILNSAEAIGEDSGEIEIRAAAADGEVELSVSDNGPGFPAHLLREGISPFRRGRLEGTGLGLSIVARIVRNLDGRMELQNLEPQGACVRMTLPCRGTNG